MEDDKTLTDRLTEILFRELDARLENEAISSKDLQQKHNIKATHHQLLELLQFLQVIATKIPLLIF